jgi:putative transposase
MMGETVEESGGHAGIAKARIIVESWRRFYNTLRPHGSPGYKPLAPEVFIPAPAQPAALSQPPSPFALMPKPSRQ